MTRTETDRKKLKKLTIEFPVEEFIYLKMACAKLDVSLREFVTKSIIKSIEDYEDELDKFSLEEARKDVTENGVVSWAEMCKEMSWKE